MQRISRGKGVIQVAKSAQELAKERLARIEAAMNLQEPDRVPVWGFGGDIVPEYSGYHQL